MNEKLANFYKLKHRLPVYRGKRPTLSDHDVEMIHALKAEGLKSREIAQKFEVSTYAINAVLAGRSHQEPSEVW